MRSIAAKWILSVSLLSFSLAGVTCVAVAQAGGATSGADAQIQSDLNKTLSNKKFKDVKSTVQNGEVTLSGTVAFYSDKKDADNKAHHRKNVTAVHDQIEVAGPVVEDSQLQSKLSQKLVYDRVGYGTTTFNAFTMSVRNGVVTLGGTAYAPEDKDSALNLVGNYPGVKDVVDNIVVAPTSPMDDRIRIAEARAIYGAPQLNRYAIDPGKPIRITVVNGNVTLSGVVDSESDKTVANLRASGVPGVFKVTNNLQVAGNSAGR
jgi:hyperosmotically inducible protein